MKPGIYATKKAITPITTAIMRIIRSSLSSGNMTQDEGISLEYIVAFRALSKDVIDYLVHVLPTSTVRAANL